MYTYTVYAYHHLYILPFIPAVYFAKSTPHVSMESFAWFVISINLWIILICHEAIVFGAPPVAQRVPLVRGQPVVVEIPPNSIVNITIEQNSLRASSEDCEILPDKTGNASSSTTTPAGPTAFSSQTSAAGNSSQIPLTPSTFSLDTDFSLARFTNSQNTLPVIMLPLGSEGPHATRDTSVTNTVPASSNTILTSQDKFASPQGSLDPGRQPVISQNRRVEIRLIDFQMNRTGATVQNNTGIAQNLTISVKFISGSVPVLAANEDLEVTQNLGSLSSPTIFHGNTSDNIHPNTTIVPHSTSGFQLVFNSTYNTSNENKVSVQRIITAEQCGQVVPFGKGYLEVSVKPSTDLSAADKLLEGYYKCVVPLDCDPADRESNAYWSQINQCNSGELSNFSYRLWLQTRYYTIDGAICQKNPPVITEHN